MRYIDAMPALIRCLLVAILLAGLAACASRPTEPEPEPAPGEGPVDPDGSIRHTVDNEAVALLWEQAEEARQNDELRSAISALERALRVAPEDPVLWSRLAELQLERGEDGVAENFAARSNSFAADHSLLRYRNWLIIAAAREQRGDREGARQARAEAERLRDGS